MDELAGAAGGARGVVGLLDQRDRVAARGRVERHAGNRDPAAHDHHVEALAAQRSDGVRAGDHAGILAKAPSRAPAERAPQAHREGHDRHLRVDLRRGRHGAAVGHVEAAHAVHLQVGIDDRPRRVGTGARGAERMKGHRPDVTRAHARALQRAAVAVAQRGDPGQRHDDLARARRPPDVGQQREAAAQALGVVAVQVVAHEQAPADFGSEHRRRLGGGQEWRQRGRARRANAPHPHSCVSSRRASTISRRPRRCSTGSSSAHRGPCVAGVAEALDESATCVGVAPHETARARGPPPPPAPPGRAPTPSRTRGRPRPVWPGALPDLPARGTGELTDGRGAGPPSGGRPARATRRRGRPLTEAATARGRGGGAPRSARGGGRGFRNRAPCLDEAALALPRPLLAARHAPPLGRTGAGLRGEGADAGAAVEGARPRREPRSPPGSSSHHEEQVPDREGTARSVRPHCAAGLFQAEVPTDCAGPSTGRSAGRSPRRLAPGREGPRWGRRGAHARRVEARLLGAARGGRSASVPIGMEHHGRLQGEGRPGDLDTTAARPSCALQELDLRVLVAGRGRLERGNRRCRLRVPAQQRLVSGCMATVAFAVRGRQEGDRPTPARTAAPAKAAARSQCRVRRRRRPQRTVPRGLRRRLRRTLRGRRRDLHPQRLLPDLVDVRPVSWARFCAPPPGGR